MTESESVPNETSKRDKYNDLLKQIDEFPSLDEWWSEKVFAPTLRVFLPQLLALIFLEGAIIYSHNWLAAFLCAVIIVTKAYRTLTMMSVVMVQAYLTCQIRDSFIRGIEVGKTKIEETEAPTESQN